MAGSPKIAWVLPLLTRFVPHRFYAEIPGWPQATVDDHGRLLDGIQTCGPDRTRRCTSTSTTPANCWRPLRHQDGQSARLG